MFYWIDPWFTHFRIRERGDYFWRVWLRLFFSFLAPILPTLQMEILDENLRPRGSYTPKAFHTRRFRPEVLILIFSYIIFTEKVPFYVPSKEMVPLHIPLGVLPYKNDGGTRRKFSETTLKGTRILIIFVGVASNSFTPLKGTNSEMKKLLPWIWPFSRKKLRSESYLCNRYGYGFRYFIRFYKPP